MKNFKKSLLVVPALGVLMLAAAGSVGGTVAWFSSANTFNTEVSSFAVGRLNGDLSCTMTADRGTLKQGDVIVVGKVAAGDATLTHASYDHAAASVGAAVTTITNQAIAITGTYVEPAEGDPVGTVTVNRDQFLKQTKQRAGAYTFTFDGSNWDLTGAATQENIAAANLQSDWGINLSKNPTEGTPTVIATLTNTYGIGESSTSAGDWMYSTSKTGTPEVYWYYAVSWKMTFSYSFGSDTTARNIYLDTTSSIAANRLKAGSGSEVSNKGFRIAFTAGTRTVVWAPDQDTPADIRYIRTPAPYTEASYVDGDNLGLVYSGIATTNDNAGVTLKNDATQGKVGTASINKNYIGQLTTGAGSSIEVKCVAWFEGTDPNIVNSASLHSVAASLKFFAVPHQAA